ncbi:hypothetical protein G6O69_28115 [Pseudenhygromyxa sp. WMMC2535]|uniref:hypothetical protein n=1 Tax=Pseudenhygromyxa sp. WMMC2535 TaxID=2712867 RepID=UPI001553031E|nr:hypothetical protein [Pseudenhygromyxa sp. WMMC2535]NVB41732.1 hypothetical protein [Pseudenhygromyxa sp. WMMC2535]
MDDLEPRFPVHYYYDIPHMTGIEYVELVRELLRVRLQAVPKTVERAVIGLEKVLFALDARIDALEYHGALSLEEEAIEVAFEARTDSLASLIYGSISYWTMFRDPSFLELFDAEQQRELELEANNEMAHQAKAVLDGLFGEDGRELFRMVYPDRARAVVAMLRTLCADDLGVDIRALVQEPLSSLIEPLRHDFERETGEHLRTRDESCSLGDYRATMRWAIAHYAHELGQVADRWSQDSCDRVNAGLMPLADCCRRMRREH